MTARGVFVPNTFMRLCEGNANTAMLVSQLFYWLGVDANGQRRAQFKLINRHGESVHWVVKQYAELEAETYIKERTLKNSMKWLKEQRLIEVKVGFSPFHSGERAMFITFGWPELIAALIKLDGYVEVFPESAKNALSESADSALSYTEITTESKDKDVAPKPARYDYLKSGSKFDRNSTAGTDSDEKAKVGLEALAPVDLDVVNLVVKHNPKAKKELSAKQVELLRASVATLKGEKPSPYDMAVGYPALWKRFVENIEDIPAWKKRVVENRERVTPGLVIAFFRGYEWQGGLLSYFEDRPVPPPSATDFYEDT